MAKGGYQRRRLEQKKQRAKMARKRARRRKMVLTWGSTILVFGLIVALVLIAVGGGDDGDLAGNESPTPTPSAEASLPDGCTEATPASDKPTYDAPPEMQIDPSKSYTATIVTNCGEMTAELFADEAPKTVNNFVFLAREGFYDGLLFHRVIDDFMIQGGDPQGTGGGGPGYAFEDENADRAFDEPGLLAMANSGPGTNGSQFFITEVPNSHLNVAGNCPGGRGCHSVFGKITDGDEALQRIVSVQTDGSPPQGQDRPLVDIVIQTITITEA